jgi:hypothetical protein
MHTPKAATLSMSLCYAAPTLKMGFQTIDTVMTERRVFPLVFEVLHFL